MAFGFDPRQRAGLSALGYKPPVNPWEKYGYREEDVAGLLNTSEGDIPILEDITEVQPAPGVGGRSDSYGLRGGAGAGGDASPLPRFNDEVTVSPAEAPDFVNRFGTQGPEILGGFLGGLPGAELGKRFAVPDLGQKLDELPGDEETLARLGRGTSEAYNLARELHPMGRLLPEHQIGPETQATLDRLDGQGSAAGHSAPPGQLAPSTPGSSQGAGAPHEIGLTPEQWRAKHGMSTSRPDAGSIISSFSSADRDPMFADVNQDAPEALDQAGTLRRRELATGGTEWTGSPHESIDPNTGQPTKYGSISITMHGQESPEQRARVIEGMKSRAFNAAPSGPDPQAEAMMRLAGVGGGGGHIMQGVAGPDVSQASLEHAMQQRAAQAQLSDMESKARTSAAQATATERDPMGIERLKAQQAIDAARFGYQNEGRREVSLADDQFRAQQKAARDAEEQRVITDHLDSKRALQEQLAKFPPNPPPGSPEAAQAAMLQRQLDSLNEETQLQLSRLGVRLPNTPY